MWDSAICSSCHLPAHQTPRIGSFVDVLISSFLWICMQGFLAVRPELDLVEVEDQFTHEISIEYEIDPETALDVFKPNPQFLEDEKAYENVKKCIFGDDSFEDGEGSKPASDDEDEYVEEDDKQMKIKDETKTNLVNLQTTIYLTIMSSVDFEEAGHKLSKIKLEPGQEMTY